MICHAHHGNDHGKPQKEFEVPSRCHKCPLGDSNPIAWNLFLHFMNVATPSNVLSFLLKSHVNTAIYIYQLTARAR